MPESRYILPMRVLNIMLGKGLGGIEQSFLDYGHALQSRGHEVQWVLHPAAKLWPMLEDQAAFRHGLPNWGEWDWLASRALKKLYDALKPEVVIAHGNRALGLARNAGIRPIVTVMHNYKIRAEKADYVLSPTHNLQKHAEGRGVKSDRITIMPNMVRVPGEMRQRSLPAKPVIGTMGRMVAKKGFEVFIAAMAILKARGIAFRAVIAGDGEEMEALKSQAQREGIAYEVEFLGWVEHAASFFDIVDIFCLPSHHEPFGIVLLEAMAQALPVVSTASEGPSEIITHGQDGLLIPVGEATAMADALEDLLHDPQRAERLGRNAYYIVRDNYDLPIVAEKLELALHVALAL